MQIEDLVNQYSKMNTNELLEKVRELRRSRTTKKETSNKPEGRPKAKEKASLSFVDLLNGLGEDEKKNMAMLLEAAMKKGGK
jgi:hypothetical protein